MPRKKTEIEKPPVSKGAEKPQCHIHDKVYSSDDVIDVRENVCVNDLPLNEFAGKYYCLFHLPTKNKNIVKFEQIFQERLEAVEQKAAEIDKLPEDKQIEAISELRHDYRYVWFPSEITLYNLTFVASANFISATFSAGTNFMSVIFLNYTNFSSATFSDYANFAATIFSDYADFSSATFSDYANFVATMFSAAADFSYANFEEHSQISFTEIEFYSTLNFNHTNFKGYVAFEGSHDNRLFVGEKNLLDLQTARIDDAKKISFHTVRLEPSWFINTDATDFIFTDCRWRYAVPKFSNIVSLIKFFTNRRWRYAFLKVFKNSKKIKFFNNYKRRYTDSERLNIKIELQNLKNREFENPNALLTKTCWQLADNHEESKNFPKASLFRQMANESKRLEDFKGWKIWSLHWWYWLSSFYGERPLQAVLILAGILFLFAFAFMFSNFQVCPIVKSTPEILCEPRTLSIWEAILQSLATATFQSIEYVKPNSNVSTFLIILEKIIAPLQAALLALAIRRKFMR